MKRHHDGEPQASAECLAVPVGGVEARAKEGSMKKLEALRYLIANDRRLGAGGTLSAASYRRDRRALVNLGFEGDELIEAEKFLEYRDESGKLYHQQKVA